MKRILVVLLGIVLLCTGCEEIPPSATRQNVIDTQIATENILINQNTPTDIDFSLERYNLIKRAYWVNGQREKAMSVPCNIDRPIGYCVLFSDSGAIVQSFTVDGKVTSLNSYLSADSEYYELATTGGNSVTTYKNQWLADVDGSYGTNMDGIFFFTIDGRYVEWVGKYLYSDIPFTVNEPVLKVQEGEE